MNDAARIPELRRVVGLQGQDEHPRSEVGALLSLWCGAPPPRPGVRHYHLLFDHAKRVVRSLDLEDALRDLRRRFHVHLALTGPPTLHFVHAGVVEWRGRALLLPSMHATGKTRLLAALLERGARYVSDTFAVIDARGRAHPYPTSVATWNGAPPFAPQACRDPLPVGWVADLRYDPDGDRPLERAGPALLAQSLFEACVTRLMRPEPTMRMAARLAERAVGLAGTRGEAGAAADRLLERLDGP